MFQLNIRYIVKLLGLMHILESFFMLSAAVVSLYYRGPDLKALLISTVILFCVGFIMFVTGRNANDYHTGRREGILCVALTWAILSFYGMLPFLISGAVDNVTDAYFETMSGFTSTGATIFNDVEVLPKGLLFWRSLMQWQGGIGMIVFTVAFMPMFGGIASQLFDAESSGITHDRFLPRIKQVAKRLFGVYLLLTIIVVILFWIGPMNLYDAINHAMTAVSTGGFSTKNAGISYWNSPYLEYITGIAMCIGATNFTLIYFSLRGQSKKLFRNEEFQWFYAIIGGLTLIVTVWLLFQHIETNVEVAFRKSFFQIASLISSTGYLTADFTKWGPFFYIIALMIMTVAGCAGSTSGGLKMGRFIILVKNMMNEFKKQTHPNAILPIRISDQIITSSIVNRVLTFTFVYIGLIVIGSIIITTSGISVEESFGLCVSSIGGVGPGIGKYWNGNFHDISAICKWTLSFLMMAGRLEVFTVLTIFLPSFWKR